jgi:hypothetical protein
MANKKRRRPNQRASGDARAAVASAEREERAPRRETPPRREDRRRDGDVSSRRAAPTGARAGAANRSRAEKKELARQQREAMRRRIRRRQRMRQGAWAAAVAVAVAVGVFAFTRSSTPAPTGALPGLLRTDAPWPANAAQAQARAEAIDLPRHGPTLALHHHADVQIFVHGQPEPIPVSVGIDENSGYIASIHTHTGDGVVHVESSTRADFTLQQFFDVWGVRLTDRCLGAYCDDGTNRLEVWQDGRRVAGDPGSAPLDDHSVIVLTYGTRAERPDPIPSSFDFSTVSP